jgi:hypothetical protein
MRGQSALLAGLLLGAAFVFGHTAALAGPPAPPAPAEPEPNGWLTVSAEPTLWYVASSRPSTPVATTPPDAMGILRPAATLGDENIQHKPTAGARLTIGYQFTEANPFVPGCEVPVCGAEARFLFVGQRSFQSALSSVPRLIRPVSDLITQPQAGVVIAEPGLATGALAVGAKNNFWGAEANAWCDVCCNSVGTTYSVEIMGGARYLNMNESINLASSTTFLTNLQAFPAFAGLAGNRVAETESFVGHNNFYGGQAGVRANAYFNPVILTGYAQLAMGVTAESLNVNGQTVRTAPDGTRVVFPGAVLARPGTTGRFDLTHFAYVPEMGITGSIPVLDWLTLRGGFSALYWSDLLRPGDQVRQPNSSQLVGLPGLLPATAPATPSAVVLRQSGLWLLGVHVSAELRF